MEKSGYKDTLIVKEIDVQNSWSKIVHHLKTEHKPVFVASDNASDLDVIILSYKDYQSIQSEFDATRREQLGKKDYCCFTQNCRTRESINSPYVTL